MGITALKIIWGGKLWVLRSQMTFNEISNRKTDDLPPQMTILKTVIPNSNALANTPQRLIGCQNFATVYSTIYCWKPDVIMINNVVFHWHTSGFMSLAMLAVGVK